MVLFMILALILLFLIGFVIFAVSVGGAVTIIIFADVIVCIIFIVWLIRKLFKR